MYVCVCVCVCEYESVKFIFFLFFKVHHETPQATNKSNIQQETVKKDK